MELQRAMGTRAAADANQPTNQPTKYSARKQPKRCRLSAFLLFKVSVGGLASLQRRLGQSKTVLVLLISETSRLSGIGVTNTNHHASAWRSHLEHELHEQVKQLLTLGCPISKSFTSSSWVVRRAAFVTRPIRMSVTLLTPLLAELCMLNCMPRPC